ncbi:MAG TPA: hypothetical protein VHD76_20540 [Bryobacteraceae bacterium]|jgi:hypothetical protein|nr:hypothetical protein [Bryobacteraceae bacterium]
MAALPAKRTENQAITRRDLAVFFAATAVASGQSAQTAQPDDVRTRLEGNRARLNAVELPFRTEPAFVFRP